MRRRGQDAFEIGEEQLLDEPAVALASQDDSLGTSPAGESDPRAAGAEDQSTRGRSRPTSIARSPHGLSGRRMPRIPAVAGLGGLAVVAAAWIAPSALRPGGGEPPPPRASVAAAPDGGASGHVYAYEPERRGMPAKGRAPRGGGQSPPRQWQGPAAAAEPAVAASATSDVGVAAAPAEAMATSASPSDGPAASVPSDGQGMSQRETVIREFGP